MKVLFISSINRSGSVSPLIKNQRDSLTSNDIMIDYYGLKGIGILGYVKNIIPLRKHINQHQYEIIHAHYLLSGIIASLTFKKPILVSLMGSELFGNKLLLILARFFSRYIWNECIVKTMEMYEILRPIKAHVVPNGVNLRLFIPVGKSDSRKKLGWNINKKHILFAANPSRTEKNFQLTYDAFQLLDTSEIVLHTLENIPNDLMPFYYNAADIVMLTSHREGSPNVIKEAMACNRPIIATDVGDIKNVIGSTENCFVCDFDADQIAEKINYLLENNIQSTNGRENIQHLSDEVIADKIIAIYKKML